MNADLYEMYFDPDELDHLTTTIANIQLVYQHLGLMRRPTLEQTRDFVYDTIVNMRAQPELESAIKWRIVITRDSWVTYGYVISVDITP